MRMVSINYWNLINVFREVWQKVSTLCSRLRGELLKGPSLWSKNIDIHWETPYLYALTSVCGYIHDNTSNYCAIPILLSS
jgi:hypothetical protein